MRGRLHLQIIPKQRKGNGQVRPLPSAPGHLPWLLTPTLGPAREALNLGTRKVREALVCVYGVGTIPAPRPQDDQVMNDDPLILFNVRKNLLLKLLITLQMRNSLRSNLVISKRMGPKMRREGWLHQGNLRTIPKCCPSACRAELVATGPTHKCERTLCYAPHRKGDVRNSDTWPYSSVSRALRWLWLAAAASSRGEFWRPTLWVPNPTPSLTIYVPSLCVFAFSPAEEIITALTD